MYLAYFIVSALELLDVLESSTAPEEREGYIEWIYHCQHPKGGFRMWPGTDFNERACSQNARWDSGHVPATYFALTTLMSLGDDLQRLDRVATLNWLQAMQRSDGSFGETFIDGRIEGGRDPRYGYCAAAIRDVLRGLCSETEAAMVNDIDTAGLARCVLEGQSYDGGIADAAFHEPQAGYTFCVLGTLSLLNLLDSPTIALDRLAVAKWLVHCQTDLVDIDPDAGGMLDLSRAQAVSVVSDDSQNLSARKPDETSSLSDLLPVVQVQAAGMNGRPNKVADTCYAWWVEASLHMLGLEALYHKPAIRSYLLQLTQHPYLGGFTKFPDDKYADIYHSFMGLAALSLASTEQERVRDGMKAWDATLCVSVHVRDKMRSLNRKTEK